MIIAKFGGTSVASSERIVTLCQIVQDQLEQRPVVVVSALRGITDLLLSLPILPKSKLTRELKKFKTTHLKLAKQALKDKNKRLAVSSFIDEKISEITKLLVEKEINTESLDKLASYGEVVSSYLITLALENKGIKAKQVVATELIVTNNNFGSAEFLVEPTKRKTKKMLTPLIKSGIVPVVTGFIGSTKSGKTTTLGRGGSDYTASIIGFCLKASQIQIWTDVNGIFSADPKVVSSAKSLPTVSFKEASELAAFGARVLHPRTIRPATQAGIVVKVMNTFNPKNHGTLIEEKSSIIGKVRAISFKRSTVLVNIYSTEMLWQKGFLARIFKIFSNNNISVDLVSVSEVSISVTLDHKQSFGNGENLINATREISQFAKVSIIKDLGMVSLIGEGITSSTQTVKKIFGILDKEKILVKMVSLGATDINISLVINSAEVEKAVKSLHEALIAKHDIIF